MHTGIIHGTVCAGVCADVEVQRCSAAEANDDDDDAGLQYNDVVQNASLNTTAIATTTPQSQLTRPLAAVP